MADFDTAAGRADRRMAPDLTGRFLRWSLRAPELDHLKCRWRGRGHSHERRPVGSHASQGNCIWISFDRPTPRAGWFRSERCEIVPHSDHAGLAEPDIRPIYAIGEGR